MPFVVNVYFFITENMTTFVLVDNSVILFPVVCIAYCHFKVYFKTRRHKQVIHETRKKFLKDQRAFKVTSLIIAMILLCSLPTTLVRLVTTMFPSLLSLEQKHVLFFLVTSMSLLNSFINPIIYTVPLRDFGVAFIDKKTCGTTTLVEVRKTKCETSGLPALGLEFKKGIEITQMIHKLIQCRKLSLKVFKPRDCIYFN